MSPFLFGHNLFDKFRKDILDKKNFPFIPIKPQEKSMGWREYFEGAKCSFRLPVLNFIKKIGLFRNF
ncbi:MAG: hypothetical protein BWK80_49695 [Desulfobacteraceae bacterium IS3]|nr:MAG: hypothetical protein BWK80_49695 [Desulfobacteraceae bacterium IS3]